MKPRLLLASIALLVAACASGADVDDDSATTDSTVVDVLEGREQPQPDSQTP